MNNMKIQQQLTKKEFQTASTIALFSKLSVKIIYGIFVLLSISVVALKISKPELDMPFVPIVMIIVVPIFSYITSGKRYDLNEDIRNLVTFEFENDTLTISGSGINTQLPVKSLYKIIEKKKWFFIQQSRQNYYPISKNNLIDDQVLFLRNLKDSMHITK